LEKETAGKMFVGNYGLFAYPMSMITTVGIPYTYSEMEKCGKMFVGQLRAFRLQIMMMVMKGIIVIVSKIQL